MTTQEFLKQFQSMIDVITHIGGEKGIGPVFRHMTQQASENGEELSWVSVKNVTSIILESPWVWEQTNQDAAVSSKTTSCKGTRGSQRQYWMISI
jgi:hypothetical protein